MYRSTIYLVLVLITTGIRDIYYYLSGRTQGKKRSIKGQDPSLHRVPGPVSLYMLGRSRHAEPIHMLLQQVFSLSQLVCGRPNPDS